MSSDQSNLKALPNELIDSSLLHLPPIDFLHFGLTCTEFHKGYFLNESFWMAKFKHDYPRERVKPKKMRWKEYYKNTYLYPYFSHISAGDFHYGIIQNDELWLSSDTFQDFRHPISAEQEKDHLNKFSFWSPVVYFNCNQLSTGILTKDGTAYIAGEVLETDEEIVKLDFSKKVKFIAVTNESYGIIFRDGSIYFNHGKVSWNIDEIKAKYIYLGLPDQNDDISTMAVIDNRGKLLLYKFDPNTKEVTSENIDMPEPISILKFAVLGSSEVVTYLALSEVGNVYIWLYKEIGYFGETHFSQFIIKPSKLNLPIIRSIEINLQWTDGRIAAVTKDGNVFIWENIASQSAVWWLISQINYNKDKYLSTPSDSDEKLIDISFGEEMIISITNKGKIKICNIKSISNSTPAV